MSVQSAPRLASRKAIKHARVQQLITADEHALAELQALIATLPMCSTGRVFIEVPDAGWIGALDVPSRMVVSWLPRSERTGEPGTGKACATGQALVRAVTAWADEMLCTGAEGTHIHLLGGYLGTAEIVDHLTGRLGVPATGIHTPERFGLATAR